MEFCTVLQLLISQALAGAERILNLGPAQCEFDRRQYHRRFNDEHRVL